MFQDGGYETISKVIMGALDLPGYEGVGLKSVPLFFVMAVWYVWMDAYTAVLTLFLWACGICTAIILWQGKRVLDTIMKGEPFTLANAANLRRAAVCCFIISGAALARTVWGIVLLFHRTGFDLQCPVRTSFPVGRAAVYGHVRTVPPGGGAEGGQRSDHLRGRGHGDCSQSGCDDGQAEDVPQ